MIKNYDHESRSNPMNDFSCSLDHERLALFYYDGLEDDERRSVQAHLHDCAACEVLLAEFRNIAAWEAGVLGEATLSEPTAGSREEPPADLVAPDTAANSPAPSGGSVVRRPDKRTKFGGAPSASFTRKLSRAAAIVLLTVTAAGAYNAGRNSLQQTVDSLQGTVDAYMRKVNDLTKRLEEAEVSQPSIQTPDSRRWEFDQARKVNLMFGSKDAPGELGIRFRGIPGPPYYTGADIVWDAEKSSNELRNTVYNEGYVAFTSALSHKYDLPPSGGKRRVTVKLWFYTTGPAMREFNVPEVIVESIDLILTPSGIRMASESPADAVTAEIQEPVRMAQVDKDFRLAFSVRAKDPEKSRTGAGVLHILIHPLDGAPELAQSYWVQPFRLDVTDLYASGRGGEQRFSTWLSLTGILAQVEQQQAHPTHFEVLLVNLPVRLAQAEIAKDLLDLTGPGGEDLIMARLEVQLNAPVSD